MNKEFLFQFASFLKQRLKQKTNIIRELSNYVNYTENESDTDKYFKNTMYDYDELYFEFLFHIEPIEYNIYCELDREKIIEYALYLIGKNIIN